MSTVLETVKFAWQHRRAWWFTATARSRERFTRTLLGSFWLGLSNLLSITALSLVYAVVFQISDFNSFVVYLGTGMVIWGVIAASVGMAPILFTANADNLMNSNLNPVFYTLEEWAFQIQTFAQSFVLVLLALSVYQHSLFLHLLTAGLLPLANLLIFLYWFPLLLCLIGARYADFFQLVPIILQLMFLVSPILYKREVLGHLGWIADLNPLYRYLSSLRHALLHGQLKIDHALILLALNLVGSWYSIRLLNKQRKYLPFMV